MWWLTGESSFMLLFVRWRGEVAALAGWAASLLLAAAGIAEARTCEVAIWLDPSPALGALQVDIDYSAVAARFAPIDTEPACSGEVVNAIALFGHDTEAGVLTASIVSLLGFEGPLQVASCTFEDADGNATSADLALAVRDSSTVDGQPVTVAVHALLPDCGDTTTTTTTSTTTSTTTTTSSTSTTSSSTTTTTTTTTSTSTTTTTLGESCGNGVVDGDEQCDDGNAEDGDGCEGDCTAEIVCGDASGNDAVQTGDALLVLRSAIGQPVPCPLERCDTDGDDKLRTADALRVLKRAVGQSVVMACPPPTA